HSSPKRGRIPTAISQHQATGTNMNDFDFDVGIIGGGPGGSGLASYLAKAGLKCIVLEKEIFPRQHVRETLGPSSTRVFRELGFMETMEEYRFPHKFGAIWTSTHSDRAYEHDWEGIDIGEADIRFAERDQPDVPQPYTYHVDRGLFDKLLLEHAEG